MRTAKGIARRSRLTIGRSPKSRFVYPPFPAETPFQDVIERFKHFRDPLDNSVHDVSDRIDCPTNTRRSPQQRAPIWVLYCLLGPLFLVFRKNGAVIIDGNEDRAVVVILSGHV